MPHQLKWVKSALGGIFRWNKESPFLSMSQMLQRLPRGGVEWAPLHRGLEFRGRIQDGDGHNIVAGVWTRMKLKVSFRRHHF